MSTRALRLVVTVVLVVSAALFAIGVGIERHAKHREGTAEPHAAFGDGLRFATEHAGETGGETASEHRHAEEPAQTKPSGGWQEEPGHREIGPESGSTHGESSAQRAHEKNSERIFGVDIESTGLVVAAVAVSLIFAVALWLSGSVAVPFALAGFALVAAVFDVRELFHQIDESRTNLTVIAAVVAALHLTVVAGALNLAQRARSVPSSAGGA